MSYGNEQLWGIINMKNPYWHEQTDTQREAVFKSKISVGEFMTKYLQPDWCKYPNALEGQMGCWSLIGGMVTGPDYCTNCDCCAHYKEDESVKALELT